MQKYNYFLISKDKYIIKDKKLFLILKSNIVSGKKYCIIIPEFLISD